MLLPSQRQTIRGVIQRLSPHVKDCGLDGSEFNDRVTELKELEAKDLIRQGLDTQLEYIISTYGFSPEMLKKAEQELKEIIMDHAPSGKLCRCSECKNDELRAFAVKHGETWLCQACAKILA